MEFGGNRGANDRILRDLITPVAFSGVAVPMTRGRYRCGNGNL